MTLLALDQGIHPNRRADQSDSAASENPASLQSQLPLRHGSWQATQHPILFAGSEMILCRMSSAIGQHGHYSILPVPFPKADIRSQWYTQAIRDTAKVSSRFTSFGG